jgi:hypothetical protein
MALRHNDLGALAICALLMAGCSASTEPPVEPPGIVPQSQLSLRADVGPELLSAEVFLVPSDSLILRATVQGTPDDYGVPVISASDTTALERRNDGTAAVRHPGDLILTVTALPKVMSARSPVLSATARLHVMCTAEARAGLTLTLQDSATGQPLAGSGSMRLRATSVAYADSVTAPFLMSSWTTAWERPGTYAVTADVDGYQPWRRDNVEVSHGICHVRTAVVLAKLQRR